MQLDNGCSCLKTARSALWFFLIVEGYQIGKHTLICKYLMAIQNISLSLPKYSNKWNVGNVISYLAKTPDDNVKTLTPKVVTLLGYFIWTTCSRNIN